MYRLKLVLGVGALACAVFVSTAPAGAFFRSSDGKSTSGTSSGTGGFVFSSTNGSGELVCNDVKAVWKIQTLTKQEVTTKGAHLQMEGKYEGEPASGTQEGDCEWIVEGEKYQVEPIPYSFQYQQGEPGQTSNLTMKLVSPAKMVFLKRLCGHRA